MWEKSYVVFTENDAIELAFMYKAAVEEGFAYKLGAQTPGLNYAEIQRLYQKAVKFVEVPCPFEKAHLDDLLNKPGVPRLPKKSTWGTNTA